MCWLVRANQNIIKYIIFEKSKNYKINIIKQYTFNMGNWRKYGAIGINE